MMKFKYGLMLAVVFALISSNAFAATITGIPPDQREDNSPFNLDAELQGFKVYCGLITKEYVSSYSYTGYTLPITEWTLSLPVGIHYCAVTTIDTDGRESTYSNEITVTVSGKYLPKPP